MSKKYSIQSINSIKNQLVDKILIIGTTIGFFVFVSSLFPFEIALINNDFFLDIIGLGSLYITYLFRKKLTLIFKSNIIIAMLFLLFISDVFENGLDSPDFAIVVLIPFLSILIYSFRISISLYLLAVTVYLTIGILFINGIITSNYYSSDSHSLARWIEVVLVLSVVTMMITLFLNKFNATIYQLIENLETQKEDLVHRESLLSVITKNIPRTILTVIDREFKIEFTDGIDYRNWEMDPKDLIGKKILDTLKFFDDDIVSSVIKAFENAFNGRSNTLELKQENEIILYKILPLSIENDEIKRILVVSENITEQVKNQQLINDNLNEKNVLLQEIHHRVKNNLAVVSSLLTLQSFKIEDPKSKLILEKSTNRIMSIAKVHEMLYESKNFNRIRFDRYINELSTIIMDSMNYDSKPIQFNTDISVEYISINHGVPLGIIFNELITNSVKYGFNGGHDNSINISVNRENDRFQVIYEDNGIGIEDFETASSKSLGFTLVESLMQQINAKFEFDTENKFKLSFNFPVEIESNLSEVNN